MIVTLSGLRLLIAKFQNWLILFGAIFGIYAFKLMQIGHVILHAVSNFFGFGCPLG